MRDYLLQRPGSQNWRLRLPVPGDVHGRYTERSLGTPDRAQAEVLAAPDITAHKARLLAARPGFDAEGTLLRTHIELAEANAFIARHHRHHKRIPWHRFSLGAMIDGRLVGVATCGRPLGGQCQDRWLEVTRLASDGTRNVCSFLYGACARAAFALGYARVQTYILKSESGVSLKAAGWQFERMSHPAGWHKRGRPLPGHLQDRKQLWFRGENSPIKASYDAKLRPWERAGMSRASWFRLGKPAKRPIRQTQRQAAAEQKISVRTLQRRLQTTR